MQLFYLGYCLSYAGFSTFHPKLGRAALSPLSVCTSAQNYGKERMARRTIYWLSLKGAQSRPFWHFQNCSHRFCFFHLCRLVTSMVSPTQTNHSANQWISHGYTLTQPVRYGNPSWEWEQGQRLTDYFCKEGYSFSEKGRCAFRSTEKNRENPMRNFISVLDFRDLMNKNRNRHIIF